MGKELITPQEDIISKLASTYQDEKEKLEITRDLFLVTQTKTTGLGDNKRKLNPFEALTYIVACRELGLTPALNHLIMLEDNMYITLQGHLQNAHNSKDLIGFDTEMIAEGDGPANKNGVRTKTYRYRCIIQKKVGENIATFKAEGYADLDSIKNKYANNIFIEQMAEARAMRRCLSRAFPVGMANVEDIEDDFAGKTQEEKKEERKEEKAQAIKDKYSKKEEVKVETTVEEYIEEKQTTVEEETKIKELEEELKEEEPELTLDQMKDQRSIIRLRYNTSNKRYEADPNYGDNKLERDNLWQELQEINKKIEDREMEEINTNPTTNGAI